MGSLVLIYYNLASIFITMINKLNFILLSFLYGLLHSSAINEPKYI